MHVTTDDTLCFLGDSTALALLLYAFVKHTVSRIHLDGLWCGEAGFFRGWKDILLIGVCQWLWRPSAPSGSVAKLFQLPQAESAPTASAAASASSGGLGQAQHRNGASMRLDQAAWPKPNSRCFEFGCKICGKRLITTPWAH